MGIFDFRQKKNQHSEPEEQLTNFPQLLTAKLLFAEAPVFDKQIIVAELSKYFHSVDSPDVAGPMLFLFPDTKVSFTDGEVAAQCSIFFPGKGKDGIEIPEEALQQNWHWPEAAEAAAACRYEVVLSDFMTRQLDYKVRLELFTQFLMAVVKATRPQVVYSVGAQKLLATDDLLEAWDEDNRSTLHGFLNVRLFQVGNGAKDESVMDTVGLYVLGLPDFQVRFTGLDPSAVGALLWNYAYYTYAQGDIITDGSTIQGVTQESKWQCERQEALVGPDRLVLAVEPT
ncbi:DUF4261 domain-containing protein [Hymenobacter sp. HSC-4F20]|uniref:DUF4261 domain-containing protein n=1 Tax=Hymenobacter sp. HSC-4F20 TaxID=2864135 RepID=UPI001C73AD33|nr:DUF4261 domain-containing protein [Hymenobacter sp. HSC-4F20]MBX0292104.1 DUF4261 domain-containing protein [Hymenobacter sp. HSC-4F20]